MHDCGKTVLYNLSLLLGQKKWLNCSGRYDHNRHAHKTIILGSLLILIIHARLVDSNFLWPFMIGHGVQWVHSHTGVWSNLCLPHFFTDAANLLCKSVVICGIFFPYQTRSLLLGHSDSWAIPDACPMHTSIFPEALSRPSSRCGM